MLKELCKHNDLGSLKQLIYVINLLKVTGQVRLEDIKRNNLHHEDFARRSIEGAIAFLTFVDAVEIEGMKVKLTFEIEKFSLKDTKSYQLMLNSLFVKKIKINHLHDFPIYNWIKFDSLLGYQIPKALIPIKFASLRNLLVEINFFSIEKTNPAVLLVNPIFLHELKHSVKNARRIMDLEDLKLKLKRQEEAGYLAEQFVLTYEMKRLGDMFNKQIELVSEVDVTAGFDIASFETPDSVKHDRFIEVKSYNTKTPSFFWSRNEKKIAEIKGESYYIYLVDRLNMNNDGYNPIIINNPIKKIFESEDWYKYPETWYISKK